MEKVFNLETKKQTTLRETMILAVFAIFCVDCVISSTVINTYKYFWTFSATLKWIVYFIFLLDILISFIKREIKPTLFFNIYFILSLVYVMMRGQIFYLVLGEFFILFNKYDFKKLLNIALKSMQIVFFVIILLTFFKFIPNWKYLRSENHYRYSLGFAYPTVVSARFLFLMLIRMYLVRSKVSYVEIILYAILNVLLFKFTDTRVVYYLATATLIVWIICKYFKHINIEKFFSKKIIKILCLLTPLIIALATIICCILYGSNITILKTLDVFINQRLRLSYEAYEKYGINLFGKNIIWYGWGGYGYVKISPDFVYNYVDISYMRFLFDSGYFGLFMVLSIYVIATAIVLKNKDYWCLFILFIFLIYGIIDNFLLGYEAGNFFIFIIGSIFFKKTLKQNCI